MSDHTKHATGVASLVLSYLLQVCIDQAYNIFLQLNVQLFPPRLNFLSMESQLVIASCFAYMTPQLILKPAPDALVFHLCLNFTVVFVFILIKRLTAEKKESMAKLAALAALKVK
jgi:hypothetical protein